MRVYSHVLQYLLLVLDMLNMLCSSDPFFLNDLHSKELSTDCVFDELDLAKATFAYDAQLIEVFQFILLCQLFSLLCEVTFKVLQLIGALVCPFN